jgi:hypothetical protein
MDTTFNGFQNLDLTSTKPTSVSTETIEIDMTDSNLFSGYARAFVNEAMRVAPLTYDKVQLTEKEVEDYTNYLLTKRIEMINLNCPDYRKLKVLYIPVWIQYNLSMVGEVIIRERGLKIVPVLSDDRKSKMTYEQALAISDKIGAFERDLQIVRDAMPREITGDEDVMTTALIDGYVRSIDKVSHVASTYVTAFMGMKLKEEAAFKVLYRVQYDDLEFISAAITHQKGLF